MEKYFSESLEPSDLMLKLADELIDELDLKDKDVDEIEKAMDEYLDLSNYNTIQFVYYGEPKAQARARVNSNFTHFYDPDKSFKQFTNEQVRNQLSDNFKPISKEIYFKAKYYKTTPKGFPKRKKVLAELGVERPVVKPDLDNYEKLFYDALKGLLFTDDSVIIRGFHEKYYSCKPRVEVTIYYRI